MARMSSLSPFTYLSIAGCEMNIYEYLENVYLDYVNVLTCTNVGSKFTVG